jgi:hypothetical protein
MNWCSRESDLWVSDLRLCPLALSWFTQDPLRNKNSPFFPPLPNTGMPLPLVDAVLPALWAVLHSIGLRASEQRDSNHYMLVSCLSYTQGLQIPCFLWVTVERKPLHSVSYTLRKVWGPMAPWLRTPGWKAVNLDFFASNFFRVRGSLDSPCKYKICLRYATAVEILR